MKLAFITPTDLCETYATQSDYHLVLTHVYEADERYRNFYKGRVAAGDFVILDNSAYELGGSVSLDRLEDAAADLNPAAVFLPDTRFDMMKTLRDTEHALKVWEDAPWKKFAVPQGSNFQEVITCYQELLKLGVDGFGFYEEIGEVCGLGTREEFLRCLEKLDEEFEGRLLPDGVHYHLLGGEEDVTSVKRLSKFSWVHGMDSAKAVVYGIYRIRFLETGAEKPYPHRPKNYFDIRMQDLSLYAHQVIQHNITTLKKWAQNSEE